MEGLRFKLDFRFFARRNTLKCSYWDTVALVFWLRIKDFRQRFCMSDNVFMSDNK